MVEKHCRTECPWGPEEWKDFGRMVESVDGIDGRLERIERTLDEIGNVKRQSVLAGGGSGAAAGGIFGGLISYFRDFFVG